jgi:hypothetical protein
MRLPRKSASVRIGELRNDDRFAARCRRFAADVDKVDAACLREDRRRFADRSDVHRARVQPFEQLWSTGKLEPLHADPERREPLFKRAARLQYHEISILLITDPQHRVALRPCPAACRSKRCAGVDSEHAACSNYRRRSNCGLEQRASGDVRFMAVLCVFRHRIPACQAIDLSERTVALADDANSSRHHAWQRADRSTNRFEDFLLRISPRRIFSIGSGKLIPARAAPRHSKLRPVVIRVR